jgi:predicted PurR-regulated permease PerM
MSSPAVSCTLSGMSERPGERSRDWQHLRLWEIQPIRDLLVLAGVLALVYLGYRLSVVTVPILLALLLAYLFEPLVSRLVRSRLFSRQGAAAGVIVGAGVVIVVPAVIGSGFAVLQGLSIAGGVAENTGALIRSIQAEGEVERREAFNRLTGPWRWAGERIGTLREEVEAYRRRKASAGEPTLDEGAPFPEWKEEAYQGVDLALKWVRDNAQTIARSVSEQAIGSGAQAIQAVFGAAASVALLGFGGFLTAFFFYFFCTGYGRVLEFWEGLIPERKKGRVIELARRMDGVIAGFVRGRLTIAAILGVYMIAAYWVIGVPTPLLLGAGVGVLFLLPYVHGVGVPLAMLLMVIEPSSWEFQRQWWWVVFAPIGVYVVAQVLDDYVLSPMIQGKTTGLEAPMILFASIAGGALAGFYGLLLAIPFAACVKIVLNEVFWPRFRAWAQGRERDVLPIGRE